MKQNKVISGKNPFSEIDPFCSYLLFVLTLASDMALLYGNSAFSVLVLSTKSRYYIFL